MAHAINSLADGLVRRFKTTHAVTGGIPKWAWLVVPPIPLIGQRYRPGKGLLIYASAENLTWMNKGGAGERPTRFQEPVAWNRYRQEYEAKGRASAAFFPNVGIQPMTDGGLFAAGLFISQALGLPVRKTPRAFLETLAVSNWCKFSIRSGNNRDHIGDVKKLTASLPFVIGELADLRPAVVMLPKAVWRHPLLRAAMHGASPATSFTPVPQFNATVVNTHLRKFDRAGRTLARHFAGQPLATWMANLTRISQQNAWRYIAMLDAHLVTGAC